MMTMLHSVWSGGGSATARWKVTALMALLALVASVLVWASPSHAQNTAPPIAIATVGTTSSTPDNASLDGSESFDPDGGDVTYKWEVVTDGYSSWLSVITPEGATTEFVIPSAAAAARWGQTIEFRLTVTDDDTPSASATDTVIYNINQRPTADIAVSANLEDKTSDEEGADRYTIDAVIDGPGENGNADNEWDIMEGALVVLDGTGSSDPNGRVTAYSWTRIRPASGDSGNGFAESGTASKLSTDDAATDDVETVGGLAASASPFYVYYRLNVTDSTADGATAVDANPDRAAVVKIVVWDQPAAPKAKLFATTISDSDGGTEVADALALLSNGTPGDTGNNDVDVYGTLQKSVLPSDTPRWIVSPGATITLDSGGTEDPDGDAMSYEWEGAKKDSTTETRASLKVDKDAEDGTVLTVTVTATDNSQGMLSGSASIEFLVVDGNTRPDSSTGSTDSCATPADSDNDHAFCASDSVLSATAGAGLQYITADGAQGGDMKNGKSTGRVTFRGVGFDPDQSVGTLIYAWSELTTDPTKSDVPGAITADSPAAVVDPDEAVLELEGEFTDTVSFAVPEVDETTTAILAFSVIDQNGVAGTDTVTIVITPSDSNPTADAGADQIVEPETFVRLNGGGSSDPDKGDSISTYAWKLTDVESSPAAGEVVKSVANQVTTDLKAVGILNTDGKLFVVNGDTNSNGVCDDDETTCESEYGQTILTGSATAYPYFDAPKVANGITSIHLTFELTVTDSVNAGVTPPNEGKTDTDTVTITVTKRFFSGDVTGPSFCSNASLGGPTTYPFDSDGDGTADICSLRTTRRASVARQNALLTLVATGATLSRTDKGEDDTKDPEDGSGTQDDRTSQVGFAAFVVGQEGVNAVADSNPDDDEDDSEPAVAAVDGTCDTILDLDKLGDSAANLATDSCFNGTLSGPLAPPDPASTALFFSGVVTGPDFCANLSLGGFRMYAFDSDDDGVADVCSLPYTRRETVARQNALELFAEHPQYANALAAACTALGSTDFGDSAAALAKDECNPTVAKPDLGEDIPRPTS